MKRRVRSARLAPPKGLSAVVRAFWEKVVVEWQLSEEGLEVLRVAVEARERMLAADRLLAREGLVVRTRRGAIRAHPAARIRREAEGTFLQALRQLGLEE